MAQVSKIPVKKEVYEQIFGLLLRVLSEGRSEKEASTLLNDLLTPTEKIVLAKRLAVALLLAKGFAYEEIRDTLKVSRPTIATINIALKYKGEGYRSFVEQVLREQKIKKVGQKALDLILGIGSFGKGKGTGVWQDLKWRVGKERRQKETPLNK